MENHTTIICLSLLIFFSFNSLLIGYIIGRLQGHSGVSDIKPKSFFSQNKEDNRPKSQISIDDKKFVTDIKTDNLEKKYESLGEKKTSSENISGAINKLKSMKG